MNHFNIIGVILAKYMTSHAMQEKLQIHKIAKAFNGTSLQYRDNKISFA